MQMHRAATCNDVTRAVPGCGSLSGPSTSMTLAPGLEFPALSMVYGRNEEIFGEGEAAEFIYKVIGGAVRTVRMLSDGRRQIAEFYLPGDVFGIEVGGVHHATAEAIGECRIALVRRATVERAAGQDVAVARQLWCLALRELERAQDHQLMLGRKSALERVVTFLRSLTARQPSGKPLDLPMGRADIADYLGLTIETVSRMMTQLERDRVITLPTSRQTVFCNARALASLDA